MTTSRKQRPNVVPWPPLLLGATVAMALLLESLVPTPEVFRDPFTWTRWLGVSIVIAGIGLDLWALITMRSSRTTFLPHRRADKLVTSGPFAITRNPMYLGNTIVLIGAALAFGRLWLIAAAMLNAVFVQELAIKREEQHLAARFGKDWSDYATRVPRWLGPI